MTSISSLPLVAPQPTSVSSSVPSPSQSTGTSGNSTSPPGSELYLFTFLTTLLLLLGVSVAIIIRSLILRRRFRRRVQEAIANGVLIPGLMTEPSHRDIGEKPKMWNVWIGTPEANLKGSETTGEDESDMPMPDGLASVLPIAATKAASSETDSIARRARRQSGLMPSHQGLYAHQPPPLFHRFWPRRPRTLEVLTPSNLEAQTQTNQAPGLPGTETRAGPSASNSVTIASTSANGALSKESGSSTMPPNAVQVSLLIAMPSATQSRYEAYVAQSNPNKSAISLPLPTLHPLGGHKSMISTTETDVESTRNPPTEATEVETVTEDKSDTLSRMNDENHLSHSPSQTGSRRYQQHRLSESSIAKGKMPEFTIHHSHPHNHATNPWGHLEEGEIPYMEFGVLEVVLEGSVSTADDEKASATSGGSSGSSSSR